MKKSTQHIAAVLCAMLFLAGCVKEKDVSPAGRLTKTGANICGTATTVNLMAGQHMLAGSVTVANDADNLYVTYTTTGGWTLTELHLYAGACTTIPVTGSGNPIPGQFPYANSFSSSAGITSYTYTIPLSSMPECMCVAAHAVVRNAGGGTETAWGQGVRFKQKGNWGMKFNYCKQTCNTSTCALPYTYWFEENGSWPTVTVAGLVYDRATALQIYDDYNTTGNTLSYAFITIASLQLSNAILPPSVLVQKLELDNWIASYGRLVPATMPFVNDPTKSGKVDEVNYWIFDNPCP